jgi:homoserine O-succinyltransferase
MPSRTVSQPNSLRHRSIEVRGSQNVAARSVGGGAKSAQLPGDKVQRRGPRLRVGLVNNMPDRVLEATERQFRDIFQAAVPDRDLDLQLFQISGIRRHPEVLERMAARYRPAEAIAQAGLSALVVTGAKAGDGPLKDSPYWAGFAHLVDLTVSLQLSTLWSCLAAHAAVERLDGIERQPLGTKCSGFFRCASEASDPLLSGIENNWVVPHSRYNGLSAEELVSSGYQILTNSRDIGPDVFIRRGPPLFIFCQGHPEYDRDSLLQEYQRDVRAYLNGARAHPPASPAGPLDAEMERSFARLTQAAAARQAPDGVLAASADAGASPPEWRPFAVGLYRNWIGAVAGEVGPVAAGGDRAGEA